MKHICSVYIIGVLDYSLRWRDWHSDVHVLTGHFRWWLRKIFVHCHGHAFVEGVVGLRIVSSSIFFITLFDHSVEVYIHRLQELALCQMVEVLLFCFLICGVLLVSDNLFYLWAPSGIRSCAKSSFPRIGAAAISASIRGAPIRSRDGFVLPTCRYDICGIFHLIGCWP